MKRMSECKCCTFTCNARDFAFPRTLTRDKRFSMASEKVENSMPAAHAFSFLSSMDIMEWDLCADDILNWRTAFSYFIERFSFVRIWIVFLNTFFNPLQLFCAVQLSSLACVLWAALFSASVRLSRHFASNPEKTVISLHNSKCAQLISIIVDDPCIRSHTHTNEKFVLIFAFSVDLSLAADWCHCIDGFYLSIQHRLIIIIIQSISDRFRNRRSDMDRYTEPEHAHIQLRKPHSFDVDTKF